jgi:hypothetical protein
MSLRNTRRTEYIQKKPHLGVGLHERLNVTTCYASLMTIHSKTCVYAQAWVVGLSLIEQPTPTNNQPNRSSRYNNHMYTMQ